MNQADMVTILVHKTGQTPNRCIDTLHALIGGIAERLAAGEPVRLPGIGTLSIAPRAALQGRNPRTGEPLEIGPGHRGKLSLSEAMKGRAAAKPHKAKAA